VPPPANVKAQVSAKPCGGVKLRLSTTCRSERDPEVTARRVLAFDQDFLEELGSIGDGFVAQMADSPACVEAFEAWCEVFKEAFDELEGTGGGDFVLEKEMTWELFLEVLGSMPSGKAVGEGGFHAEMLRVAGVEVQRAFYEALMADLRGKRVPKHWRKVIYVLLPKPGNDDSVVSLRREIALMAHAGVIDEVDNVPASELLGS
jgi:hypothetical protein